MTTLRAPSLRGLGDTDYSDTTYTGAPDTSAGSSVLSMDYYRNKAREFQGTLDALVQGMAAAQHAIDTEAVDSDTMLELFEMLQEADARRMPLRLAAESLNAIGAGINAAGGRFPQLSIPTGLGILPAVPLAMVAVVATIAGLTLWVNTWLQGLNGRLRLAQQLDAQADPAKRGELAHALALSDASVQASQASPLAHIANVVKWGALGVGAWLVYQAWRGKR